MLATTRPHSALPRATSARCPAWSAPMVGMSATLCPASRQAANAWRSSATLRAAAIMSVSASLMPPSCVFSRTEAIRQRAGDSAHQAEIQFGPVGDVGAQIVERGGAGAGTRGHRVQQRGRGLRPAEDAAGMAGRDLGADFLDSPGAGLAAGIDRDRAHHIEGITAREILIGVA